MSELTSEQFPSLPPLIEALTSLLEPTEKIELRELLAGSQWKRGQMERVEQLLGRHTRLNSGGL